MPGVAVDCHWQRECPPSRGDSAQPAQCGDRQREPQAREPRDEQGKVSEPPRGCAQPRHNRSCRLRVSQPGRAVISIPFKHRCSAL